MKTVGIIGGLSPESTILYYQGINAGVRARLGGHHNAHILIDSLNFAEFVALKEMGDWDTQEKILCRSARNLEKAGADFIVLATNTMHKMADGIIQSIGIPFLHLADATASQINKEGIEKVGLLGTKYTMEETFYTRRLEASGIDVIVPDERGRIDVNAIIYDELCHGQLLPKSRMRYVEIISDMHTQGIQGVILGCTEISSLISVQDVPIPVFDTTKIHIGAAIEKIFEEPS